LAAMLVGVASLAMAQHVRSVTVVGGRYRWAYRGLDSQKMLR
jgi:amino acid transporter